MLKFKHTQGISFWSLCAIFLFFLSCETTTDKPNDFQFKHFITAEGPQLMDGDSAFKFLSFNVPTLNYIEDNMGFDQVDPYGLPTVFELKDLYETLNIMGGNVIRAYTIPVRNDNFPSESVTYVEGPGQFNELAFQTLDSALALAQQYQVRVILPLVNNWQWMGGRPNYADFRNKSENEFWTDSLLISDFKKTVEFVLNRTNTVTGVQYKNDKTILAWETGNELENPASWALEIAKFIKSIDKNHLLMDGYFAIHGGDTHIFVQDYAIEEPLFDIISTHHYENNSTDMITDLKKTVELVGGKKPLIVGEFGFIGTSGTERVLDYLVEEPNISGSLLWSLRRHHPDGGFYQHTEPFGYGLYRAYHWPGFDDGVLYDERNLLKLYREKSFAIRGLPVPAIQPPAPPKLLNFKNTPMFSWQGSAGASGYNIERAPTENGPWTRIAYNVDDAITPGFDIFSDPSIESGSAYFYRIKAINEAGISEPSNVVGGLMEFKTRVDYAVNLMILDTQSGIAVKSGNYRSYKEAYTRLEGVKGAVGVYDVPGAFESFKIYTFQQEDLPNLSFSVSKDGEKYTPVEMKVDVFKSDEKNYAYLIPTQYTISAESLFNQLGYKDIKYLRFDFSSTSAIVRSEMVYK